MFFIRPCPWLLLPFTIMPLAADPSWWAIRGVLTSEPAANFAPANIGQAKYMAKSAIDALRAVLPAVANQIEVDLTSGTSPVLDFTVPDPKTPVWLNQQKAPLLIGQLKAIADPFYARLNAADPGWLEVQRITNATNHPGSIFPWTADTTDDANKAVANIGQLKAVFSLHFDTITLTNTVDTDGDGMPNEWEIQNSLNPNISNDAAGDADNDGISNLLEYMNGLNPNFHDSNSDSDMDGVSAGNEIMIGTNNLKKDNPAVKLNVIVGN